MKIVFTSCMDAERVPHQPIWDNIREEQPDVLMLLGDQIYMDWGDLGASNWRQLIKKKPDAGLQAFAIDMHRRYALQWEVPEFQKLITDFSGRANISKFLMTWDDHDFAWNNALGEDGDTGDLAKHGVATHVKAVSYRLFKQFEAHIRNAYPGTPYPNLPLDWDRPLLDTNTQGLFWQGQLADVGPECLLLDTRWNRKARAAGASILGYDQYETLKNQISKANAGLLIVAAGTPMAYKYLISQQAWKDGADSYFEYDAILSNAVRPVLFLGGDVHRNEWSGRLSKTDGSTSTVVQILSSGAAIGNIGFKRFLPSYGIVVVPETSTSGAVNVELCSLDSADQPFKNPSVGVLKLSASDWIDPLHGTAQSQVKTLADVQALTVLCARKRQTNRRTTDNFFSSSADLEEFDVLYKGSAISAGTCPEPLLITLLNATKLQLGFQGNILQSADREDELEQAIRAAFCRANTSGKLSVVLFIHGFGKSFSDSLSQAYLLRSVFPQCEPILYSWEAGQAGGLLAAINGVASAQASALEGQIGLSKVLEAFGRVAAELDFNNLAKVIVARSAGSIAMRHALEHKGLNFGDLLSAVNRIILSSPLLKWSDFNNRTGFGELEVPIIIMRNQNDQTLKFADWLDGVGAMLGLDDKFKQIRPTMLCIDYTHCPRVGTLHDYLFLKLTSNQYKINSQLLTQKLFNHNNAVDDGLLETPIEGVFNVRPD